MVLKNSYKSKSKNITSRGYIDIIMIISLLIIDRITKIWASSNNINKDYGIMAFTYVTNTGAGFSIMQNMNILLTIIAIIALIVLIYYHNIVPKFSLITIASGITGNSIDRIIYGGVIDFINLKFWPIFNIADSLIFIGVAYWIIIIFKEESKNNNTDKNKKITKTKIFKKKR